MGIVDVMDRTRIIVKLEINQKIIQKTLTNIQGLVVTLSSFIFFTPEI